MVLLITTGIRIDDYKTVLIANKRNEVREFLVHLGGLRHCIADRLAHQRCVTLAKPIDHYGHRIASHAEGCSQCRIGALVGLLSQVVFDQVELSSLILIKELLVQPRQAFGENTQSPGAIIETFRGVSGCEVLLILMLGLNVIIQVKWQLATSTLRRPLLLPLMRQKMPKRGQKKRTEFPAFPVGRAEIVFPKHFREKSLGQILSIVRTIAESADIGIKGVPVGSAELFESRRAVGRIAPGGNYDAPVGCSKTLPPSTRLRKTCL